MSIEEIDSYICTWERKFEDIIDQKFKDVTQNKQTFIARYKEE